MKQRLNRTLRTVAPGLRLLTAAGVLVFGLAGCMTGGGGPFTPEAEAILKGPYYYEYLQEGSYYLVGRPATAVAFEEGTPLPAFETLEQAGPKGEPVVIEIDPADPELKAFLWKRFVAEHLFYAEEISDGRLYVLGSEAGLKTLREGGALPHSRTLEKAGPGGRDVILESDPANEVLARRLEAEFKARHQEN